MVRAIQILKFADDFERKLTPEGEPYYEPFEDFEKKPSYDLSEDNSNEFEYNDDEISLSNAPQIQRLSSEELVRATKLIYLVWFEAEVKIEFLIKNTQNYMKSAGIPNSIILNFNNLAGDISNSINNIKQLAHWKHDIESKSMNKIRDHLAEVSTKSEILHSEIQNISEYINGLTDIYSLFDYYLEELFAKGKDNSPEWRLLSMSSRLVEKLKTTLETAKEETLNAMQHKKMLKNNIWDFEK